MAVYFPYKKKPFSLMGGYLGDRGAGPMGSGNIEIPHLPPPGQRTPEQSVSGGLPTHRLNQLNRWWDIEKSPNLNKWGSMPTTTPSGGNVFANLLGRPETDTDFWDALKEQLEGAGADYDKADQPFGLTGPKVGGQVPVPKPLMPSLMGGTPTGGSYNPYLAKRKRAR